MAKKRRKLQKNFQFTAQSWDTLERKSKLQFLIAISLPPAHIEIWICHSCALKNPQFLSYSNIISISVEFIQKHVTPCNQLTLQVQTNSWNWKYKKSADFPKVHNQLNFKYRQSIVFENVNKVVTYKFILLLSEKPLSLTNFIRMKLM